MLFFALLPLLALFRCAFALNLKGADISSLIVVEDEGVHFTDNGQQLAFETILTNHGLNAARVRVWTAGQYDLSYALQLAKRIKAAGIILIVDLHFSDTCKKESRYFDVRFYAKFHDLGADPGHQAIPAGWPTTLSGLNTQVWE